jgi:hypothetical protein
MGFLVDSAVGAKVNRQSLHINEAKHSTQWRRRVITACHSIFAVTWCLLYSQHMTTRFFVLFCVLCCVVHCALCCGEGGELATQRPKIPPRKVSIVSKCVLVLLYSPCRHSQLLRRTNPGTEAEPQQIVAQRLLSCLQYPVP